MLIKRDGDIKIVPLSRSLRDVKSDIHFNVLDTLGASIYALRIKGQWQPFSPSSIVLDAKEKVLATQSGMEIFAHVKDVKAMISNFEHFTFGKSVSEHRLRGSNLFGYIIHFVNNEEEETRK